MNKSRTSADQRTTAIGLSRYAYEYIEAALLVDEKIGSQPGYEIVSPTPALYLAGHGIELSLKSYLMHEGATIRDLRRLGHDLHSALRKAKELGLYEVIRLTQAEEGALELLNDLYRAKELEYIRTGLKHFPLFALVEKAAIRLHNAVSLHVGFGVTLPVAFHGLD